MPALGEDSDVMELLHRFEITPDIKFSTVENFSTMSMIEQGLGMSIMNELITESWQCNVAMLPLESASVHHTGDRRAFSGECVSCGAGVHSVCGENVETIRILLTHCGIHLEYYTDFRYNY